MRAWTVAAIAAAGVPLAAAWSQAGQPQSIAMLQADGRWSPALFVCDGTTGDRVYVVSAPDRRRRAMLTVLTKPGLAARAIPVTLGAGDAGMSQVRYALSDAAGEAIGSINTVSPAVVEPGATTPTVTSVTMRGRTTGCRFAPQTRALGATAKRSVMVTASERSGYIYRSYDHDTNLPEIDRPWGGRDTRASLTVAGGRLVDERGGRRVYEFRRGAHVYRVFASVDPARPGGGVAVRRGGQEVLAEPFGAYVAALPR